MSATEHSINSIQSSSALSLNETIENFAGEIRLHLQLHEAAYPGAPTQIRRLFLLSANDADHAAIIRNIAEWLLMRNDAAFSVAVLDRLRRLPQQTSLVLRRA